MRVGVIGGGIFGLAAALALRARGHDVSVFEQSTIPHEHASSTDVSKTIRRFYGRSGTYVELAERAAVRWREWDARLGGGLYHQIGQYHLVRALTPGTRIYDSWRFLAGRSVPVEVLSAAESRRRFPQFAVQAGDSCLFDPWAGFVASGRAVAGVARLAGAAGVTLREATPIRQIDEQGGTVACHGPHGAWTFDRVVVATGVWLRRLVPSVGQYVQPTRQEMAFFAPPDPVAFGLDTLPVWAIDPEVDGWYGHPIRDQGFVKVANDLRGSVVDPDAAREVSPAFVARARAFLSQRIPGLAAAPVVGGRVCLYENTPDHDFLIDWVPGSSRVLVAGGGSGHGFKFGGSIGEVIADALEDRPNPLLTPFRLGTRLQSDRPTPQETPAHRQETG
jgi:glycine/D-amino acid oxidase-like deaminating enzyme